MALLGVRMGVGKNRAFLTTLPPGRSPWAEEHPAGSFFLQTWERLKNGHHFCFHTSVLTEGGFAVPLPKGKQKEVTLLMA